MRKPQARLGPLDAGRERSDLEKSLFLNTRRNDKNKEQGWQTQVLTGSMLVRQTSKAGWVEASPLQRGSNCSKLADSGQRLLLSQMESIKSEKPFDF